MKRNFKFYLDNNTNLHIKEKGIDVVQIVQYPQWVEDFQNFERDVDKVNSTEIYPLYIYLKTLKIVRMGTL